MNQVTTREQKRSQAEKAYEYLRAAILEQKLLPGYPLIEMDLSAEMAMSRTPIREAINRLMEKGLVEKISRKGVIVKSLSREDIRQSYEMAEGLEGMVAYLAALNADRDSVDSLATNVEIMEFALVEKKIDLWITGDENFHSTLYAMCQNKYIVERLTFLYEQIHLVRLTFVRSAVNITQSTQDHRNMYAAIQQGEAEEARRITQNHWQRVRKELLGLFR
jgi:DNA-binding GntR family transcriptional regulator